MSQRHQHLPPDQITDCGKNVLLFEAKGATHKAAPVEYPVHHLIRERWSPRAFADKLVSAEILRSLFEAARWAPSSFNAQPWGYLVATREDGVNYEKMLSLLVASNQSWAKTAPVLGLTLARLHFAHNGEVNRNAFYDAGAATAFLTLEAMAHGILVHQMAGFDRGKARDVFAIPEGWEAIAAFALGYVGSPDVLPEQLRKRETAPRTRKAIGEFVWSGTWGQAADFIRN